MNNIKTQEIVEKLFFIAFHLFVVIPVETCLPAGRRESSLLNMLLDARFCGHDIYTAREEFSNSLSIPDHL
ncbi:MAG: hypothetical protein V3R54_02170 [Thermodesulfovibrionia bacterium]